MEDADGPFCLIMYLEDPSLPAVQHVQYVRVYCAICTVQYIQHNLTLLDSETYSTRRRKSKQRQTTHETPSSSSSSQSGLVPGRAWSGGGRISLGSLLLHSGYRSTLASSIGTVSKSPSPCFQQPPDAFITTSTRCLCTYSIYLLPAYRPTYLLVSSPDLKNGLPAVPLPQSSHRARIFSINVPVSSQHFP